MVLKFQDNLGHFSYMCQNGQVDVLQVCSDHFLDPNACSTKMSVRNCNISEVDIMQKDPNYPIANSTYGENTITAQVISDSFLVFPQACALQ